MMHRYLIIASLLVINLHAVKTVERKRVRAVIPEEECIDGKVTNPHNAKKKAVCADRVAFTKRITDGTMSLQEIFSAIYDENYWLSAFSRSGFWSNMYATKIIRQELYPLCVQLRVKRLLDLGCGDYYWMQTVQLEDIAYIGVDIVPEMITINRRYFQTTTCTFMHLDATSDPLPQADLILCRDLLENLSYDDAFAVLRACKASGASYILLTTHADVSRNDDHLSGLHGRYNLMLPPFNLPEPLLVIDERSSVPQSWIEIKQICLWDLDDIIM